MSALRLSRVALRSRPVSFRGYVQRRGYAEAVSDKIKLSLALPHQVRELHGAAASLCHLCTFKKMNPNGLVLELTNLDIQSIYKSIDVYATSPTFLYFYGPIQSRQAMLILLEQRASQHSR
jgi:hypothetical protein